MENIEYDTGFTSVAFIGIGRMTAVCDIPNDVQPGVPGGGLFGPDAGCPSQPKAVTTD